MSMNGTPLAPDLDALRSAARKMDASRADALVQAILAAVALDDVHALREIGATDVVLLPTGIQFAVPAGTFRSLLESTVLPRLGGLGITGKSSTPSSHLPCYVKEPRMTLVHVTFDATSLHTIVFNTIVHAFQGAFGVVAPTDAPFKPRLLENVHEFHTRDTFGIAFDVNGAGKRVEFLPLTVCEQLRAAGFEVGETNERHMFVRIPRDA